MTRVTLSDLPFRIVDELNNLVLSVAGSNAQSSAVLMMGFIISKTKTESTDTYKASNVIRYARLWSAIGPIAGSCNSAVDKRSIRCFL